MAPNELELELVLEAILFVVELDVLLLDVALELLYEVELESDVLLEFFLGVIGFSINILIGF